VRRWLQYYSGLCLGGFSGKIVFGRESVQSTRTAKTELKPVGARTQSKFMKVFLRDTQNGWYYQEPSKWTPKQEAALDVAQVARAVELIFEAHLENVEILLCYDDPRYDLVLPVPPSPSRHDPLEHRHPSRNSFQLDTGNLAISRKKEPLM
jgi:hypothetical protein